MIAFSKSKADASLAFIANIPLTHKHVLLIVCRKNPMSDSQNINGNAFESYCCPEVHQ
jgi:hypothetical protein